MWWDRGTQKCGALCEYYNESKLVCESPGTEFCRYYTINEIGHKIC